MASISYSTPGWHEWVVPDDVTEVQIDVRGAGSAGREGGRVLGKQVVQPGQSLFVLIGSQGNAAVGRVGGSSPQWGGGGPGGDGHQDRRGGDSGAGATIVRREARDGRILAVAAGAGGRAGQDSALGGLGGADTGGSGQKGGGSLAPQVAVPTGGTQSGSGQPGINTTNGGSGFNGKRGQNSILGAAGAGGTYGGIASHGGGGGGGGYYPGSGGTASNASTMPATGGSGGSNYTGNLSDVQSWRGEGSTSVGLATLNWSTSPGLNQPPTPPTDVYINGIAEADELSTRSVGNITISATMGDPNASDVVRMIAQLSASPDFPAPWQIVGPYVSNGQRTSVAFNGLSQQTHYYARLWGQDSFGVISSTYNAINFWTNRAPNPPELIQPAENSANPEDVPVTFDWKSDDPDDEGQVGYQLRYREAATIVKPATEWLIYDGGRSTDTTAVLAENLFAGNVIYEWGVRTRDVGGLWSNWSLVQSWYSLGTTTPPRPLTPSRDEAVNLETDVMFVWQFSDPSPSDSQSKADIRYRVAGTDDGSWLTLPGQTDSDLGKTGFIHKPRGTAAIDSQSPNNPIKSFTGYYGPEPPAAGPGIPGTDVNGNTTTGIPGSAQFWVVDNVNFTSGFHYEWQVRTYDQAGNQSEWSPSEFFWTVTLQPWVNPPTADAGLPLGSLGCGEHRVFLYQQGGTVQLGEITPIAALTYGRLRDDISHALLTTNGFGQGCGDLLRDAHCWLNEIVVFRDGKRVWEGPVTRLAFTPTGVEIEAQDPMAYVYRRIMRQGYNDSYRIVRGEQVGLTTVVRRAQQIILNAMAPWDMNLLPYLTTLNNPDDARQSRVVPDYAKTAWEEVDDLAATAGLDYTTVGRRIILWDTHRSVGRLPELRDEDFSGSLIVTEYGMQLSNYYAVTNGQGVWGAHLQDPDLYSPYGPVELLASAYGEAVSGTDDVLTPDARDQLVKVMEGQAKRGAAGRWPTPTVVRVPDNSQLSPDAPVTMDQLIPGVWIPIRSSNTLREVSQWQKLDSVTVNVNADGEQVLVVMSPAPGVDEDPDLGDDPDAEEEPVG